MSPVTTEVTFWNFNGRGEFFLTAKGMGDIEYFVLVLQATMADFYKTAGMPQVIGAPGCGQLIDPHQGTT